MLKVLFFFSISNLITFGFQSENLFEMFRNAEKAPQATLEALVFFFAPKAAPRPVARGYLSSKPHNNQSSFHVFLSQLPVISL